MRIEHVALWVSDLERLRIFYQEHFGAEASQKYVNPAKRFESYFLRLASGARIELMQSPLAGGAPGGGGAPVHGYAHIALGVGSTEAVDALVARLRSRGVETVDGPRWTGDGYYEAVVLDPEGNRIEITV